MAGMLDILIEFPDGKVEQFEVDKDLYYNSGVEMQQMILRGAKHYANIKRGVHKVPYSEMNVVFANF